MNKLPKERSGVSITSKGKELPYTFWPKNHLKYGPLFATNPWQCIKSFIIELNGVDATVKKKTKVYIDQSFEFYKASQITTIVTKPLLIYYSYLNLAKAFLVFRRKNPDLRQGKELENHGLAFGELPKRYRSLKGITFKVKTGTKTFNIFEELVKECGFPTWNIKKEYNLLDMLYWNVGMHGAVTSLKRKSRFLFPVHLETLRSKKEIWIKGEIESHNLSKDQIKLVKEYICKSNEMDLVEPLVKKMKKITFETNHRRFKKLTPKKIRETTVDTIRNHIWSEQSQNGFKFYLCCEKEEKPQVATSFAAMFALSSVVRYQPDLSKKLEEEWLIHEYLSRHSMQFIYLLGSGLISNEICPAPGYQ